MPNIIDYLQAARIKKDMTQQQLADKLKVSIRTVSRWENKKREPPYTKVIQWAQILDVPLNELTQPEGKEGG